MDVASLQKKHNGITQSRPENINGGQTAILDTASDAFTVDKGGISNEYIAETQSLRIVQADIFARLVDAALKYRNNKTMQFQ